jgi:CBS domain-containing protein
MTCAEIMSRNPSYCTAGDPAVRAAELMKREDIGSVPVVASSTDPRVVGIVTDRDLTLRLVAERKHPETTAVSEIMTRNPATCHERDDVREAMETMSRQQVRRIPIVDEQDQLCGIVAQADIARHLDERETGEVLEDISQPGRNAISRGFYKTRDSMQKADYGANWLVAAGIGAAVGAGLMAALGQRRFSSSRAGASAHSPANNAW